MFWPNLAIVDDNGKPPSKARVPKPAPVFDPNLRGCDPCPLRATWGTITSPKMKTSGLQTATILALGEAPGPADDESGEALVGKAGNLLRENIPRRERTRVAYQNIVRCRTNTPSRHEAHCCSIHLDADIDSMPNLKVIIGVGAVPLRRFAPGSEIGHVHGLKFPVQIGDRTFWYFPVMHPLYILNGQKNDKFDPPALPVFRADMRRLFAEIDFWPEPFVYQLRLSDVIIPKSLEEAEYYRNQMSGVVAIDVETFKLRPYERGAELLTAAISDGNTTIAFPCNHPVNPTTWGVDFLIDTACTRRWLAHNAAMELSWLRHYNKTNRPLMAYEDSMAKIRVKHERETTIGLGTASQIQLGINVKNLSNIDTKRIIQYPLEQVLPYNGLDALASILIYNQRDNNNGNNSDAQNYARIVGSIDATTEMEMRGLPIDLEVAQQLKGFWTTRQEQIRTSARSIHEVRQYEAERGVEFNLGSSEQLGVALVVYGKINLPRTVKKDGTSGQYATDEKVLSQYENSNPLVKAALDYREAQKIVPTYIDPIIEVATRYLDGNVHPTYTTMIVATQRLSSRDPNVQNYPVRNATQRELRRMIIAMPRKVRRTIERIVRKLLAKLDFGQLEARVLAMASKDKNLCKSIIDQFDIHSYWLDQCLRAYPDYIQRLADATGLKDEEKVRKVGRDIIKSDFVFSSLYGGGIDETVNRTKIPVAIVRELMRFFWETYYGVKQYHIKLRNEYRDTGAIRTLTGRVRRGVLEGNRPINTPIQGTAADIVIEAMNEISALARAENDYDLHPRINIHDDLTFILPDDNIEHYIDTIHPIMTKIRFPWQIVPLTVELAVGESWAELHKVTTFSGDYVH